MCVNSVNALRTAQWRMSQLSDPFQRMLNRYSISHPLKGTLSSMPGMFNQQMCFTSSFQLCITGQPSDTNNQIPCNIPKSLLQPLSVPLVTFLPGILLWFKKAYLQVDTNKPIHSVCLALIHPRIGLGWVARANSFTLITECLFISACVFDPSITLSLQSVVRAQKMALWMTETKRIKEEGRACGGSEGFFGYEWGRIGGPYTGK